MRWMLLPLVLHACSSTSTTAADASVPDAMVDVPDAAVSLTEWERVQRAFGVVETIAGKRQVGTDGVNSWTAAFEGARAVDVELSRPHIAMADGQGNIFIADKDAHAIERVGADGLLTTVAGTHESGDDGDGPNDAPMMRLSQPNGLWVQPDGTLFILDLGNGKVRRVDVDGTMRTVFSAAISVGRGLFVNGDGSRVVVASGSRVLEWTAAQGVRTIATGFSSLGNLVEDAAGRMLVTDRGAGRVFAMDADGVTTVIAGNGTASGGGDGQRAVDTGLEGVRGVWPYLGGFFVATHEGSQVWFVDGEGVIHLFLDGEKDAFGGDGELWSTPGKKLSEVRAITMDARGNLVITESDEGDVRIVRAL